MHFRLCTVLLGGILAIGCGTPGSSPPAPPPPEVAITTVTTTTADLGIEVPGRVEGSREIEVRARVKGIVLERRYQEGQRVRAGDLLFVIDPAEYRAAARAAAARLAEAEARVAQAEREQRRLEPLVTSRAASQKSLDDASSAVELSRALALAAAAAVERAELELGWTRVLAPIDGFAGRSVPSEGALVEPGDNGLLTRIIRTDPAWVRFAMSSADLSRLRVIRGGRLEGLEAALLDATGRELAIGRLDFVDAEVEPNTNTVAARVEAANSSGVLVPGDFVRVRLRGLEQADAILVPQRAVQQGREGRYVLVVEGELAVVRPIEVGPWVGTNWLVERGLEPGDRVIVDGIQKVQPGAPVRLAAESVR